VDQRTIDLLPKNDWSQSGVGRNSLVVEIKGGGCLK